MVNIKKKLNIKFLFKAWSSIRCKNNAFKLIGFSVFSLALSNASFGSMDWEVTPPPTNQIQVLTSNHYSADLPNSALGDFNRRPDKFAMPVDVLGDTNNVGLWDYPSTTTARWRLNIRSQGAANLSVRFSEVSLPDSAKIMVRGVAEYDHYGPYGSELNTLGVFISPVVEGEQVTLELTVDIADQAKVNLVINKLNYGVAALFTDKSGSCNVDAICDVADDYSEASRAVGRIAIAGQYTCSGTLLNNTAANGKPYFLTARHCFQDATGAFNAELAKTVVVYWQYERPSCGDDQSGMLRYAQAGATVKAEWDVTDMVLLELISLPVADSDVYFAGWDRTDTNFNNVASLHHPRGNEKSISIDRDATVITDLYTGAAGNENYLTTTWELGTTEAGSSGGALFTDEQRVIGQLRGGNASCGNPDGVDWYGRIHKSWEGGGTPGTRLKDWLDPINANVNVINGYNPNYAVADDGQSDEEFDNTEEDDFFVPPEQNSGSIMPSPSPNSGSVNASQQSNQDSGGGGASHLAMLALLSLFLVLAVFTNRAARNKRSV